MDTHKKFVEEMLKSSQKKFEKPMPNSADVDPSQIEKVYKEIQRKIQQR